MSSKFKFRACTTLAGSRTVEHADDKNIKPKSI